jgi:hypothetical protein
MAVDQASAKDGEGEPAITGFVRAVTQPGGMNIDWRKVGAAASIIGGIAVIHGLNTRRWRHFHTFGVVLVIAAAAASRLKDKHAGAAQAPENE